MDTIFNADYKEISSKLHIKIITYLFQKIVTSGNLCLQFSSDHIVSINKDPHSQREICIAPPNFLTLLKIIFSPEYQTLDSHMKGKWYFIKGDILDFILLLESSKYNGLLVLVYQFKQKYLFDIVHFRRQIVNRKKETAKTKDHYNWSCEFYEHILGKYMAYTCAFFNNQNISLEQAQLNKFNATLDRLDIDSENMNILDVGCGWGEFAKFISEKVNAKVTGISIAGDQINYANKYMKNGTNIFLKQNYLDLQQENTYDRVVSIGILEHVGKYGYPDFFDIMAKVLKPGCIGVIHCITKSEAGHANKWMDKYIFPGGYIPEVSDIVKSIEFNKSLKLEDVYFHSGLNYVKTLECWHDNLFTNKTQCLQIIKNMIQKNNPLLSEVEMQKSVREKFRMWHIYLKVSQVIFLRTRGRRSAVHQFVIRKS